MAANKIILNGEVLIDLTSDTVTPEDVTLGKLFHKPSGDMGYGTRRPIVTQEKTATPTKSEQEIVPSENQYLSKVIIKPIPSKYIEPQGTVNIYSNGTHDVSGAKNVFVSVPTSVSDADYYDGSFEVSRWEF